MKSLRLVISEGAIQDVKDRATYIELDNPDASERFIQAAERTFEGLARTPFIGPARDFTSSKLRGLRSWRIAGFENYLVFYRVAKDHVEILRVIHGAKNLEAEFE